MDVNNSLITFLLPTLGSFSERFSFPSLKCDVASFAKSNESSDSTIQYIQQHNRFESFEKEELAVPRD